MKAKILILKCLTNMHVGSGDVNYSIIDNEVEKDALTGYAVIHSSGVKGAFRQYFKDLEKGGKNDMRTVEIFGNENVNKSDSEEENNEKEISKKNPTFAQGKIKFLSGEMIARPMRVSNGVNPYELVSTPEAAKRFKDMLNELSIGTDFLQNTSIDKQHQKLEIEGKSVEEKYFIDKKVFYIIKHEDFKEVALPVLARNQLENGESKNLWYEEVVPHESIFFIPVIANDADYDTLEFFIEKVKDKIVQFGGNATIGYGLCKIKVLE